MVKYRPDTIRYTRLQFHYVIGRRLFISRLATDTSDNIVFVIATKDDGKQSYEFCDSFAVSPLVKIFLGVFFEYNTLKQSKEMIHIKLYTSIIVPNIEYLRINISVYPVTAHE